MREIHLSPLPNNYLVLSVKIEFAIVIIDSAIMTDRLLDQFSIDYYIDFSIDC